MEVNRLVRNAEREQITGVPNSTWNDRVKKGLAPPPIKLSKQCAATPLRELLTLNAARVAGKSDDEIKELVAQMVEQRQRALDEVA